MLIKNLDQALGFDRETFRRSYRKERNAEVIVQHLKALQSEVGKVIVGTEGPIRDAILAWLMRGHISFLSPPGLGKTLLANTLGHCADCVSSFFQMTVDLLPSDIFGFRWFNEASREYENQYGPIAPNVHLALADEVNRATHKTQSALLQSMQERSIRLGRELISLPRMFFCMTTRNPIESGGTFGLIEALRDRIDVEVDLPYIGLDDDIELAGRVLEGTYDTNTPWVTAGCRKVISMGDLEFFHRFTRHCVDVPEGVRRFAAIGVRALRPHCEEFAVWMPEKYRPMIAFGSSPRGLMAILSQGQAWALWNGRLHVTEDDIRAVAPKTLAHRVFRSPEAFDDSAFNARDAVRDVFENMTVPVGG